MPTISKAQAEEIIAADGYYKDDPRAYAILVYNNQFDGKLSYAVAYNSNTTAGYFLSPACHNTQVIWPVQTNKKFYFTFAQRTVLKNAYMVVEAESEAEARAKMIEMYGKIIFAFSYTEEEFKGQPEKYGLYEIEFGYMPESMDGEEE